MLYHQCQYCVLIYSAVCGVHIPARLPKKWHCNSYFDVSSQYALYYILNWCFYSIPFCVIKCCRTLWILTP